jgi:hypothetical protein
MHGVFVYSLEDKKIHQVTDGRSDVESARFDRSGKCLWFLATTDVGVSAAGGMTAMGHAVTRSVYGAVLRKDLPSSVAPESDEEGVDKGAPHADGGDKEAKAWSAPTARRCFQGESWNPKLRAPLTEPGVDVKEGDLLLAVDGKELRGDDDVNRLFLGRAGHQTVSTVSATAGGGLKRQVTVVPVGSEGASRLRTWMEDNRKKVQELS